MIKSLLKTAALMLALQSLIFLQVFGQSQNYNSWEIDGAFLSSSSIVSLPNKKTTRIKFRVTVAKNITPVNFNFQLIRRPQGQPDCGCAGASCACSAISTVYGVRDSDFPAGRNTVTKEYEIDLYVENGTSTHDATIRDGDVIMLAIATDSPQNPTSPPFNPSKRYSVQIQLPPTTPPGAPRNLKVDASSTCSIALSWTKPSSSTSVEYYVLYINGQSNIAWTTFGPETSFTLTGLPANTAYSIYVVAYNEKGLSVGSNTVNATTSSPVPGTALNNAIDVQLANNNFIYTRTVDNSRPNCFRNDFVADASNEFNGQPSDDIFFKVYVGYYGKLQIATCGSADQENTRIHVLDYTGKWKRHVVEAYPTVCASYNTSRTMDVTPGTYYVVVERAGYGAGPINVSMSIDRLNVPGLTWTLPIHLGTLDACGGFHDYLNEVNPTFTDQYGGPGDDIFYRFTLAEPTIVRIANCSELHSFGIYLFDSNFQFIASGGPEESCFMPARLLPAGEYTVAFEADTDDYPFTYGMPVSIETQSCSRTSNVASTSMTTQDIQLTGNDDTIAIYPIPANGTLTIDVHAVGSYSVSMMDIYGLPVKTWSALQGTNSLDISQVKEGVYVVQVHNGSRTTVKRVEVKR